MYYNLIDQNRENPTTVFFHLMNLLYDFMIQGKEKWCYTRQCVVPKLVDIGLLMLTEVNETNVLGSLSEVAEIHALQKFFWSSPTDAVFERLKMDHTKSSSGNEFEDLTAYWKIREIQKYISVAECILLQDAIEDTSLYCYSLDATHFVKETNQNPLLNQFL